MFSVAVKGYGIVIWDDDGMWRTYSATESMSATLSARVEIALESVAGRPRSRGCGLLGAPLDRRAHTSSRWTATTARTTAAAEKTPLS